MDSILYYGKNIYMYLVSSSTSLSKVFQSTTVSNLKPDSVNQYWDENPTKQRIMQILYTTTQKTYT